MNLLKRVVLGGFLVALSGCSNYVYMDSLTGDDLQNLIISKGEQNSRREIEIYERPYTVEEAEYFLTSKRFSGNNGVREATIKPAEHPFLQAGYTILADDLFPGVCRIYLPKITSRQIASAYAITQLDLIDFDVVDPADSQERAEAKAKIRAEADRIEAVLKPAEPWLRHWVLAHESRHCAEPDRFYAYDYKTLEHHAVDIEIQADLYGLHLMIDQGGMSPEAVDAIANFRHISSTAGDEIHDTETSLRPIMSYAEDVQQQRLDRIAKLTAEGHTVKVAFPPVVTP